MISSLYQLCLNEIAKNPEPIPTYIEMNKHDLNTIALCDFISEYTNENIYLEGEIPTEMYLLKQRYVAYRVHSHNLDMSYHSQITSHKPQCDCLAYGTGCFTWKPNAITIRDESNKKYKRYRFDDLSYLDFWMEIQINRDIDTELYEKPDIKRIGTHGEVQVLGRFVKDTYFEVQYKKDTNTLRIEIYNFSSIGGFKFYVEFLNFK